MTCYHLMDGCETDNLDSLVKMLTLLQSIGVAVVVVMPVGVGAEWFSKEVFNVLLSLDCAVISWPVTKVSLDLDLSGESEVTIPLLKYFKVVNLVFNFAPFSLKCLIDFAGMEDL